MNRPIHDPALFGIYSIRQKSTGKVYIGSTAQNFYDRCCAHISCLTRGKHSSIYLQRAWNKHGADDFIFEILEVMSDKKQVIAKEIQYINVYKSSNPEFGFNVAKEVSPNRLGHTQSELARKRISEKMRGRAKSKEHTENISKAKRGNLNPMFGVKQSKDYIQRRMINSKKSVLRSDGTIFSSMSEAATSVGVTIGSIRYAILKNTSIKGFTFKWLPKDDLAPL